MLKRKLLFVIMSGVGDGVGVSAPDSAVDYNPSRTFPNVPHSVKQETIGVPSPDWFHNNYKGDYEAVASYLSFLYSKGVISTNPVEMMWRGANDPLVVIKAYEDWYWGNYRSGDVIPDYGGSGSGSSYLLDPDMDRSGVPDVFEKGWHYVSGRRRRHKRYFP